MHAQYAEELAELELARQSGSYAALPPWECLGTRPLRSGAEAGLIELALRMQRIAATQGASISLSEALRRIYEPRQRNKTRESVLAVAKARIAHVAYQRLRPESSQEHDVVEGLR